MSSFRIFGIKADDFTTIPVKVNKEGIHDVTDDFLCRKDIIKVVIEVCFR